MSRTFSRTVVLAAALLAVSCSPLSEPSVSTGSNALVVTGVTPGAGATVPVVVGGQPGMALPRGAGLVRVSVDVTSSASLVDTRLYVALVEQGGRVCATNLPDQPTWPPESRGIRATYHIDGFQVFRVPCEVASIRAVLLHRADLLNLQTPQPDEILAESSVGTMLVLR